MEIENRQEHQLKINSYIGPIMYEEDIHYKSFIEKKHNLDKSLEENKNKNKNENNENYNHNHNHNGVLYEEDMYTDIAK